MTTLILMVELDALGDELLFEDEPTPSYLDEATPAMPEAPTTEQPTVRPGLRRHGYI